MTLPPGYGACPRAMKRWREQNADARELIQMPQYPTLDMLRGSLSAMKRRGWKFQMSSKETTIHMPRPLCRICLGENHKLRELGGSHDLICDVCWAAKFTDKGCGGNE